MHFQWEFVGRILCQTRIEISQSERSKANQSASSKSHEIGYKYGEISLVRHQFFNEDTILQREREERRDLLRLVTI